MLVTKGSFITWVTKLQGDEESGSSGQSQSYREINLLLSAGRKLVVAKLKLQGDKTASLSSMELYDPWIWGPFRVS